MSQMASGINLSDLLGSGLNWLANSSIPGLIGSAATNQRIPGQTTAGEFLPGTNSVGATYNYIPTGASQIDPQLISLMLGNGGQNSAGAQSLFGAGNTLLGQIAGYTPQAANLASMNPASLSGVDLQSLNALQTYLTGNPNINGFLNAAGSQTGSLDTTGTGTTGANLGAGGEANYAGATAQNLSQALAGYAGGLNSAFNNYSTAINSNPYLASAQAGAGGVGSAMTGAGTDALSQAANLSNLYGGVSSTALNNPFNAQQLGGAQQAGGMLTSAGQGAYGQGGAIGSTAMQGLPAASQVLNTAFDPQNALYARTLNQTQNQLGTYLANSGLTSSGAGAQIMSDALNNFNIDWQNNQLGRQTQGLQAFNSGVGGVGQNATSGYGLQTAGAGGVQTGTGLPATTFNQQTGQQLGVLGQLGSGLGQSQQLTNTGLSNLAGGNQYASNTYASLLNPQLQALQQQGTMLGQQGSALNNVSGLQQQSIQDLLAGGQIPYGASNTVGNNLMSALQSYMSGGLGNLSSMAGLAAQGANLGTAGGNLMTAGGNLNNQSVQQMLSYLNAVMTGSNNAANATKNVAGTTTTQNQQAAAGTGGLITDVLKGIGSLFGL